MRLTCPNCGAQYEVPDEVIPLDGRDVQCSDCGHTWYQAHPDAMAADAESAAQIAQPAVDEDQQAALTGSEPQEDDYETRPEPGLVAAGEDALYAEEAPEEAELPAQEPPAQEPAAPPRHALDDTVSDILREEAQREARLREAESGGLETQPELGLESYDHEDIDLRAKQAYDRMAGLRGEERDEEPQQSHAAPRRDLLPDIEEINSTLRATGGGRAAAGELPPEAVAEAAQRGGMMRGFTVALLIGAGLLLIYGNAPRIARSVPQADPMLSAYVAMVDQARYWLDAKLGGFTTE